MRKKKNADFGLIFKNFEKMLLIQQNEPILAIKCDIEFATEFHHLRVIARQHPTVLND